MAQNSDLSVFGLITSLCEHFRKSPSEVRKARSECYSLLLGKEKGEFTPKFRDPKNSPNAYCRLLSWSFVLENEFNKKEEAARLLACAEEVRLEYAEDLESFDRVLDFLLCLRGLPKTNPKILDLSSLPSYSESNLNELFRLPAEGFSKSTTELGNQPKERKVQRKNELEEENIWSLVSKLDYNPRKTWENFGKSEPQQEAPFVSELGPLSQIWVENLHSLYKKGHGLRLKLRPLKVFINDLKMLLVGIPSEPFGMSTKEEFFLVPGVSIQGITPEMLGSFSQNFLVCGTNYRALNKLCSVVLSQDYEKISYNYRGFIFRELCNSLQRYLQFYRTAAMSLSNSTNPLEFEEKTKKIRLQLITLAKICKVGSFSETEDHLPHGVALLNYLYNELLRLIDYDLVMVLYSILFGCCQVYISRFLTPWLLEGLINDPFAEFFIKPQGKYVLTRGRTYWTRSFTIREDLVPNFLNDLKNEILNCGKAMNLLKLCNPQSKLSQYLMGKKPLIFSCCITSDQLSNLKHNCNRYFLEVCQEIGPKFRIEQALEQLHEYSNPVLLDLMAKKSVSTLRRIELERQKKFQEEHLKRQEELQMLKEQYDAALELKQARILQEIRREVQVAEEVLVNERLRDGLIERESELLISYYSDLSEIAEKRRLKAEENIRLLNKSSLDLEKPRTFPEKPLNSSSEGSTESFYSTKTEPEEPAKIEVEEQEKNETLDIINANNIQYSETIQMAIDNFEIARQNKKKVLSQELGFNFETSEPVRQEVPYELLSQAQKNKLKVLSSEYGVEMSLKPIQNDIIENNNFVEVRKTLSLQIRNEPMSLESTPLSELPVSLVTTPSTMFLSVDTNHQPNTAETQNEEGQEIFEFFNLESKVPITTFSKVLTRDEAKLVGRNGLQLFLKSSIGFSLNLHNQLANNELERFFIWDLKYLKVLQNLRDFFFLQNGEFARHLTENLFEKLYEAKEPKDIINCKVLQDLIEDALTMSHEDNNKLSFKINKIPASFHVGDPDVFDCISLSYSISWPLNILLPTDTLGKYDEVFKYLLKLNRVSWVLKKIFLELKLLAKKQGKKELYLMASPQYRRLHQCRHVMLHFIQTLQSYFVGEVLQNSWQDFEKKLKTISSWEEIYQAHTAYIKQILFMCLLNQKTHALRNVIHKIFVVILKFYDYLRMREWQCIDGAYVHANFTKLNSIFENFVEFVLYLFKVLKKVANLSYQPHLVYLLDMLDINEHYNKQFKH